MTLEIRLLGKPRTERDGVALPPPRGRKTWAVLAYLVLSERPPSRARLASLLFAEANDPLGALRWTLADLRRALGVENAVVGDPIALELPPDAHVDALALTAPAGDAAPNAIAEELLAGLGFRSSPVFESWLEVMRRQLDGASRALVHDEALTCLSAGDADAATRLAAQLVARDPLDGAGQELLIRCLARAGRVEAARRQLADCEQLFRSELGAEPGPELHRALEDSGSTSASAVGDPGAALAQLAAGEAALDAGAVEPGLDVLRQACAEAAAAGDAAIEARAVAALGTALVHAVRGRDEEGAVRLHEALRLAEACGARAVAAAACRELGYIDVQAGRASSAGRWLGRATELADGNEELSAALGVRGMALSDRAYYPGALELLNRSVARAERCGRPRQAGWSLALIGRIHILRGEIALAVRALDESLAIVAAERWAAFQPFPEAMRAEASLRMGNHGQAAERLDHSFRLACRLGDPCWEALGARMLGLIAASAGRRGEAREHLADARARATRVPDAYQWVHAYVLDSAAVLAVEAGAADAGDVVERLAELAERCDMREFVVRALIHRGRLGDSGSLESARLLAAEVDNPALEALAGAAAG